jgi:hypothetical protein
MPNVNPLNEYFYNLLKNETEFKIIEILKNIEQYLAAENQQLLINVADIIYDDNSSYVYFIELIYDLEKQNISNEYLIRLVSEMATLKDDENFQKRIRISTTRICMVPREFPNINLDHSHLKDGKIISINSKNEVILIGKLSDIVYE